MKENGQNNSNNINTRLAKIEQALHGQQRILEEVYRDAEKTRKYILWGRIISLIYLLLALTPLILAAIYLPTYLERVSGVFGPPPTSSEGSSYDQLLQMLKDLQKGY